MIFLKKIETDELSRCQIGTLNKSRGSNIKYLPFAFAMLSSVLNSETAIEINKGIMRAFVAIRQLIANPPPDKHSLLQKEVKELKQYIEEIFTDQNDINEDTRMQLELINQTLAELQVHQKLSDKPYRPIGFIRPEED